MKNHLKRLAAPKSWVLDRQITKYVVKPSPGTHSLGSGFALGFILRDRLHIGSTMDEIKKILATSDISVDGVVRRDHRFMVGLFDVISIPLLSKHYRVVLDSKGRLTVVEVPAVEAMIKPLKIVGKSVISGGKIQFHMHDGRNVISEMKAVVGDSVVVTLPKLTVKEILPLHKGSVVFLSSGKHGGDLGVVDDLQDAQAVYSVKGGAQKIVTSRSYLFVVGAHGKGAVCTVAVPK